MEKRRKDYHRNNRNSNVTEENGYLARMRRELGLAPLRRDKRDCLSCDREFESRSYNERLCGICRGIKGEDAGVHQVYI